MKNLTYFFGVLSIIFISIGAYSKLLHWAGAWLEIVIGITILATIFTPMALINHYKNAQRPSAILYIGTFLTILLLFGSALMKITRWPGENLVGQISLLFAVIIYLPLLLFESTKENSISIKHLIGILFLIAYIALTSTFISVQPSHKLKSEMNIISHEMKYIVHNPHVKEIMKQNPK